MGSHKPAVVGNFVATRRSHQIGDSLMIGPEQAFSLRIRLMRRVVAARVTPDALFAARLFALGVSRGSALTHWRQGRCAAAALFNGFGADRQTPDRFGCPEGEDHDC